jgi:hypothetical protein
MREYPPAPNDRAGRCRQLFGDVQQDLRPPPPDLPTSACQANISRPGATKIFLAEIASHTMTQSEIETFISSLDDVESLENMGYVFFFVGDDHRLPFATIACNGNEHESVSRLDREGVFRLNIGVSGETFGSLVGASPSEDVDYSILDEFLPHPHYAKQNFICILNPSERHSEAVERLLEEAHGIAEERFRRIERRRQGGRSDAASP